MDRRKFLKSTAAAGAGAAVIGIPTTANATATCEDLLYNVPQQANRLQYPANPADNGQTVEHPEWPPGHLSRYIP